MRPSFKGYLYATLSLIVLAAAVCAIPPLAAYQNPVGWMFLGACAGAMIAPVAVLLIGVPAHLALQKTARKSLRAYLWAGFGSAALLSFAVAVSLPHGGARMAVALFEIFVVLLGGPCAAAAFWHGARPDRSAIAKPAAIRAS
jgi:hypothetical protein